MFLSEKQIKDYKTDGVIIVKNIFKDWIEPLRKGFQKVLDNPSKHGRENVDDSKGRFFEDYCNWEIIEEFKDCIFNFLIRSLITINTLIIHITINGIAIAPNSKNSNGFN